jgi:hypothetical protein
MGAVKGRCVFLLQPLGALLVSLSFGVGVITF